MNEKALEPHQVRWHEGLFLEPVHFQYQDLYHETRRMEGDIRGRPFQWGLVKVQIDHGVLRQKGVLRVTSLRLVLPEGELLNVPDWDAPPLELAVGEYASKVKSLVISVGIPLSRPGVANCVDRDHSRAPQTRFLHDVIEGVQDVYTAAPAEKLPILRKNIRLYLENQEDEIKLSGAVPLLRIQSVDGKRFELDNEFVPPCMVVAASTVLDRYFDDVLETLEHGRADLIEKVGPTDDGYDINLATLQAFMRANLCDGAWARMNHFASYREELSPEQLYGCMAELAARLITFSKHHSVKDIPTYSHLNPAASIGSLLELLRVLLKAKAVQKVEEIVLRTSPENSSISIGAVDDSHRSAKLYLMVEGDAKDADFKTHVEDNFKIGSPKDLENADEGGGHSGIPLELEAPGPSALPIGKGKAFFLLRDDDSVKYGNMFTERKIGVFSYPYGQKVLKYKIYVLRT